ncbi:MATE family efflux transporter [Catenovulum sp. SM1970]|uniref:MATE family efflux transporter n=1 Tax=Marinifaba aquimaris TaxID=2741323 RepID=UPI001571800A|nr:MATE family efflux transporter [Marinifaba aquimaris]NTS75732.1 MATE family efflux transporter [Marinifaba aquimaris]
MSLSKLNSAVLTIALPMVISNITTPLLGIVDTAVVGHLDHAYYIGAVSLGAMIASLIYWLCVFLRMATTGLTAQQIGKGQTHAPQVLVQGLSIAMLISITTLIISPLIISTGLQIADASAEVSFYAKQYFDIRIWSTPAALANLVLVGWLIAQQRTKLVMWVQIAINLVNIVLDLTLVVYWDLKIIGVASASVLVEYLALIIYLVVTYQILDKTTCIKILFNRDQFKGFKRFLSVNKDILIRTLCLELCFVYMHFHGAKLGDTTLAVNAVLLNFLMLIALGLDGIAYSAEVLIGKAYGAKKRRKLRVIFKLCLRWNLALAIGYSLVFLLLGQQIINLMTDIASVQSNAMHFIIYIVLLPVIACWCFLYDGVYIGLADSRTMRNSMIISVFLVFFPAAILLQAWQNHALWLAMLGLMAARGLSLAWHFNRRYYSI